MNVKTLSYIHQLLVENEAKLKNAENLVVDARNKAEKEGAENYPDLCDAAKRARVSWGKAYDALQDFDAQDW